MLVATPGALSSKTRGPSSVLCENLRHRCGHTHTHACNPASSARDWSQGNADCALYSSAMKACDLDYQRRDVKDETQCRHFSH